ncbi:bacteriocin-protection, YdeI or OmpD-associated domain-containing protein [Trichoderma novae-zelandiae]
MSTRRVTRSSVAKAAAKAPSPSLPSRSSNSSTSLTTESRSKSTTSSSSSTVTANPKPSPEPNPEFKPDLSSLWPTSDNAISFFCASSFDQWLSISRTWYPSGIWLRLTKKAKMRECPSVTYHDAVDIALCHGWIDGQRKAFNEIYYLQRFTPRRPRSLWSRRNVQRVEVLTAEGRMKPAGVAAVDAAKADGRWERAYAGPATMEVPGDFEDALAGNGAARTAFQGLSKAQRYSFLWRIQTAVKSENRERKIREFVNLLAEGKTL